MHFINSENEIKISCSLYDCVTEIWQELVFAVTVHIAITIFNKWSAIPAQDPSLTTAAKCSQQDVSLWPYICLAVPLPCKVPFILSTHTDCSAVHNILQIGWYAVQTKMSSSTSCADIQYSFKILLTLLERK